MVQRGGALLAVVVIAAFGSACSLFEGAEKDDGDGDGDQQEQEENRLGAGDCSGASVLGAWHGVDYSGSTGAQWFRDDLVFKADCSVQGEEYEGSNLYQYAGYFRQTGTDLDISFTAWADRTGSIADPSRLVLFDIYSGLTLGYQRSQDPCLVDPDGVVIDRFNTPEAVPPAGVRLTFRVLGCDGKAVRALTPDDVTVVNDEKGTPFGSGGEGDSVSDLAPPSSFGLFSVLTLDMSDSIVNAGAQDAVIDGALAFVDQLVTKPVAAFKHNVAIVKFGRPNAFETVQTFTQDDSVLKSALEQLRTSPSLGTTDLYNAYLQSLNLIGGQGGEFELVERFVVLLTDGTHEAGDEATLRTTALTAKDGSTAETYTIGIQGAYDESKLVELASTPDNFVRAEDASKLESAFAEVAKKIEGIARSNYVIGVCTPVALGSPSLTLQVNVDGKMASQSVGYDISQLTGDTSACDAEQVVTPVEPPVDP